MAWSPRLLSCCRGAWGALSKRPVSGILQEHAKVGGTRRSVSSSAHRTRKSWSWGTRKHAFVASTGSVGLVLLVILTPTGAKDVTKEQHPVDDEPKDEGEEKGTRNFRLSEVSKHDASSDRQWIIHGTSVYDITDFIPIHPGGEIILRAAGSSIEPYWALFAVHSSPHVCDLLAQYKIGNIHPSDLVDGIVPCASIVNPYTDDPPRDPRLKTLTLNPRSAEPPSSALTSHITPVNLFFVRNHFWVPRIKQADFTLTITLPDGEEKTYSLADIRAFPAHTIAATLQCAGNRRTHMSRVKQTHGLPWDVGGISTATWTGARLSDVLHDAGLDVASANHKDAKHAAFEGAESFGASIPLTTALDPRADVLLAYAMNGADLPADHGYPLRVVAPGIVAARSVKWVRRISLQSEESAAQWQRRDYKCFGPNERLLDWDAARSIQEVPVMSAIVGAEVKRRGLGWCQEKGEEEVDVWGYAYSGGGRAIVRVDVSVDGGRTWDQAELLGEKGLAGGQGVDGVVEGKGGRKWTWTQWRYKAQKRGAGKVEVVVKATDEAYNTQPERFEGIWNARGNLANAWHRVEVDGRDS